MVSGQYAIDSNWFREYREMIAFVCSSLILSHRCPIGPMDSQSWADLVLVSSCETLQVLYWWELYGGFVGYGHWTGLVIQFLWKTTQAVKWCSDYMRCLVNEERIAVLEIMDLWGSAYNFVQLSCLSQYLAYLFQCLDRLFFSLLNFSVLPVCDCMGWLVKVLR